MKSKIFGLGASMALAILAVGTTLTSCYDSENVDIIAPDSPDPARYYIAGNITDARTGEALNGASVTMDGAAVSVSGNYFEVEVGADEAHTFTVDVDGYYTATRTVRTPSIVDGGVSVSNADFALVSLSEEDVIEPDTPRDPDDLDLADQEEANAVLEMHQETILAALNDVPGIDMETVQLTVDTDGALRLVAPVGFEAIETAQSLDVTLPYYEGFASTVSQTADGLFTTRAVTDGEIWNLSAAAALNRNFGLTATTRTATLQGIANAAINGYTFVVYFTTEKLTFNGHTGTVTYQGDWYVVPTYDGHDNHDLHSILHGNHNGAGGGNTNMGY